MGRVEGPPVTATRRESVWDEEGADTTDTLEVVRWKEKKKEKEKEIAGSRSEDGQLVPCRKDWNFMDTKIQKLSVGNYRITFVW